MTRHYCDPHFTLPKIDIPALEPSDRDEGIAKQLAAEIARIALTANSGASQTPRPCSLAGRARRLFEDLPKRDRAIALEFAKEIGGPDEGGEDISNTLAALTRRMARTHLKTTRRTISTAIVDVSKQASDQVLTVTKTRVRMRPAGEIVVTPHKYTQVSYPPNQTFHWETDEPGAERAYWELRGPASGYSSGALLDRGIVGNHFDDGRVGGEFTLNMGDYFPPVTPNPTQRFSLRVLPLGPERPTFALAGNYGIGTIDQLDRRDPEPPAGLGPWSFAAVIDYGTEYKQPGTRFDAPVTYYQRVRAKVNWFKVDNDSSELGDEEYHLHAFFTDFSPFGAQRMGRWGSYLPVVEGDQSRHPLGWESADVTLGTPVAQTWPRFQLMVLSVLEEDNGEGVDAWLQVMAELAEAALRGAIQEEIKDYLQDLRDEFEQGTADLVGDLQGATEEVIAEFISQVGSAIAGALIAYAVTLILGFIRAGAEDDSFGAKAIAVTMLSNEADAIEDSSALTLASPTLALAQDKFSPGQRDGGRYETRELEIQMRGAPSADSGGAANGIISFGVQWAFSGRVTNQL